MVTVMSSILIILYISKRFFFYILIGEGNVNYAGLKHIDDVLTDKENHLNAVNE